MTINNEINKKRNTPLKIVTKIILFSMTFLILLNFTYKVLVFKNESVYSSTFYKFPRNKIKVFIAGASNAQFGIRPSQLWNDYGIPAFNLASGRQSVPSSYYVLKEAIDVDHPDVVILDLTAAYYDEKIYSPFYFHYITDNMNLLSLNRLEMINDLVEDKDERMEFYYPLYLYHKRWIEIVRKDFPGYNPYQEIYGTRITAGITAVEPYEKPPIDPDVEIPYYVKEYIGKLIDYCEEKDVQLVLFMNPQYGKGRSLKQSTYNYLSNILDKIGEYAKERNVPFYNCLDIDVLNLDPSKHTVDGLHSNDEGAKIITDYVGQILRNDLGLKDYRNDPDYQYMEDTMDDFYKYRNELTISTANEINTYLRNLERLVDNDDYLITIALRGGLGNYYNEDIHEALKKFGLSDIDLNKKEVGFVSVINGENKKATTDINGEQIEELIKVKDLYVFASSKSGIGANAHIIINNKEFVVDKAGLNIVVYNLKDNKLISSCNFDLNNEKIPITKR